ncbi:MAG: protein-disulfide reductase DsbD N-terminal domain-containing protein [Acidobacteriota bacterium]
MKVGRVLSLLSAVLSLSMPALAQEPDDIVRWTARPATTRAPAPGQKVTVLLAAKIAPGWHVYSITQEPGGPIRTDVSVPPGQVFTLTGDVTGPVPETAFDPNFRMKTEYYSRSVILDVPLSVSEEAKAGPAKGTIDVRFQACNDRNCLPPIKVHVPFTVELASR